jgi:hypothetical protein
MIARLWLALGATGAVLTLVVLAEAVGGEATLSRIAAPARPQAREAAHSGAEADSGPATAMIEDWVRTAQARPLMTSARRPAASGMDSVALNGGLPRLAGTILTSTGATAIFARDDGQRALVLHAGASVGPYRIVSITADTVTIDGPDGMQTLHPRFGAARNFGYSNGLPGPMPGMPGMPGMPYMPQQGVPGVVQPPILPPSQERDAE